MGRYDADFGKVLINKGNGHFEPQNTEGVALRGEARRMMSIKVAGKGNCLILALNNERVRVLGERTNF